MMHDMLMAVSITIRRLVSLTWELLYPCTSELVKHVGFVRLFDAVRSQVIR